MWDGLWMLLLLSTLMAVASFLSGLLPLSLSLSPRQLRFISGLGAGVLIGTALIVIIPEGVETLYSAGKHSHDKGHNKGHNKRSLLPGGSPLEGILTPRFDSFVPEVVRRSTPDAVLITVSQLSSGVEKRAVDTTFVHKPGEEIDENTPLQPGAGTDRLPNPLSKDKPKEEVSPKPHAWVGLSMILGFILLYLIDVIPSTVNQNKKVYRPLHISLSNLDRGLHHSPSSGIHSPPPQPPVQKYQPQGSATTIGLIIHGVADGIALGASSTASSTSLSLIIFLAIMLHKAPAAFGLTTTLLKQGLSTRIARTHLVFFSLAAPTGAFATWIIVNMLGRGRLGGEEGLEWATGCMLLFSGGTFLYVAMHSMQQVTPHLHGIEQELNGTNGTNGWADSEAQARVQEYGKQSATEVGVVVLGMLIPLLTQIGHEH